MDQVNTILRASAEKPEAEVKKMMWDIGVMSRAFYTVGAHMFSEIENELGRDGLISTFKIGPAGFIELYNSIAEPSLKQILPRGSS